MGNDRRTYASAVDWCVVHTRPLAICGAIAWAVLSVGLYRGAAWATWIWPWADADMTFIFLSSITAAIAAPLLWIAIVDEPAAVAGLALDTVVIVFTTGVGLVAMGIARSDNHLLTFAAGATVILIIGAAIFRIANGLASYDTTPMPRPLRYIFGIFIAALLVVGTQMYFRLLDVFPWTLPDGTSTLIGGVFLGAAAYFGFGIRRNTWVHAGGQLAGFLAYDAVLFVPYGRTLLDDNGMTGSGGYQPFPGATTTSGDDVNMTSLAIYMTVICSSGLVAIFYLFVKPETRIWRHFAAAGRDVVDISASRAVVD